MKMATLNELNISSIKGGLCVYYPGEYKGELPLLGVCTHSSDGSFVEVVVEYSPDALGRNFVERLYSGVSAEQQGAFFSYEPITDSFVDAKTKPSEKPRFSPLKGWKRGTFEKAVNLAFKEMTGRNKSNTK